MRVTDSITIEHQSQKNVHFIRVDPEDISTTLRDIIDTLTNISWISKFDQAYLQSTYKIRAESTVNHICNMISCSQVSGVYGDAAEYIVSEIARETLVKELSYLDIPLAELLKEQVSGNPGFDFFSANKSDVIIFGEAKYLASKSAFGSGMKQVSRFISQKRDIADLADIQRFFSEKALNGVTNGDKGFAVAFSSKKTPTDILIKHIQQNQYYDSICNFTELIFIAVNI